MSQKKGKSSTKKRIQKNLAALAIVVILAIVAFYEEPTM